MDDPHGPGTYIQSRVPPGPWRIIARPIGPPPGRVVSTSIETVYRGAWAIGVYGGIKSLEIIKVMA
jgi:hypothetical protein